MEEMFYNALAITTRSNYGKLSRLKEKFGSWQAAWEKEKQENVDPEKEWKKLEALHIKLVLQGAPSFPKLLKEIAYCPFAIYVRGILKEPPHVLAIVGTRKATQDGLRAAREFAEDLASRGVAVVSGLALGIDAAAHEGALRAKGYTIAVLGNGIDRVYPATNARLGEEILASGGALVSEYPSGTISFPSHFLERNRIVGGLSHATLVVEAPHQSGSLVTARLALENNRHVLVIPGSIHHQNFKGSHELIRKGAELAASIEDVVSALGLPLADTPESGNLTSEEKVIIETLRELERPGDADTISETCDLEIVAVNRALSLLILKRIVKETGGGYTLTN